MFLSADLQDHLFLVQAFSTILRQGHPFAYLVIVAIQLSIAY